MKEQLPKMERHSLRLKEYNYSEPGMYFITICTYRRQCLFGKIADGTTLLNQYGNALQNLWRDSIKYYPNTEPDVFIVMPNHIHGIIDVGAIQELPWAVHEPPLQNQDRRKMLIPNIVGRFKMTSAKQINQILNTAGRPVWQRNYWEHVIRDDESLQDVREYIMCNPINWGRDRNNPDKTIRQSANLTEI